MVKNLVTFDWAMKKLLRSKANFGILEGFLSELLKKDIKILELLESESNKIDKDSKQNRVDILAKLDGGELALIEVQVSSEFDYFYRMLYGTSNIIVEYLHAGEAYSNIKKVYSVNILYFDLGQGKDYIYHGRTKFVGIHQQDELSLTEKQKELYTKNFIHEIYPEYYLIKVNNFNDIAKNTLDEWIYFLKHEAIKKPSHAKGLREAQNKLSELKLSDTEKRAYKRYLGDLHYQASMAETARIEAADANFDAGKTQGLKEAKIEVAKKMKAAGMQNKLIQQLVALTEEEIGEI
jgi:predicted transposase/invertase (TIGR01784 family)